MGSENSSEAGVVDERQRGSDLAWPIYLALWARAEEVGIYVTYVGIMEEEGTFSPRDDRPGLGPEIRIRRPFYETHNKPGRFLNTGEAVDILDELCTLAHEFGHYVSHIGGLRTPELASSCDLLFQRRRREPGVAQTKPLSPAQHDLVRQEEARAWTYGRDVLKELGFEQWPAFDARERKALDVYEEIFALDAQGWPLSTGVSRDDGGAH